VLWDLYQQAQIRQLQNRGSMQHDIDALRHATHKQRADELEDRIEHLTVVSEALWTLLHEKLGLTDEQLVAAVTALIEARQAAREATSAPARCPGCGAALNRNLDHCQFCGFKVERPTRNPFEGA
jgi:hypothetical protein